MTIVSQICSFANAQDHFRFVLTVWGHSFALSIAILLMLPSLLPKVALVHANVMKPVKSVMHQLLCQQSPIRDRPAMAEGSGGHHDS